MSRTLESLDKQIQVFKNQSLLEEVIPDGFIVNPALGKPAFLLSTLVHGNETLSYYLLEKVLASITKDTPAFGLLIGNRASYIADKRFIERDLNRSFLLKEHKLKEEIRAKEIESFSKQFPCILDVHQTSEESASYFYITKNGKSALNLISQLNTEKLPVVISAQSTKNSEGNTYSQFCIENKIPMTTIEVGQKGFSDAGLKFCLELYERLFLVHSKLLEQSYSGEVLEITHTLIKQTEQDQLVPGIKNLHAVKVGEVLGTVQGQPWKAPVAGFTLFPKYGEYQKFSKDLCQILEKKKVQID